MLPSKRDGASLRRASLVGADLAGAALRDANMRDADLREADLREASLYETLLIAADLRGAILEGTDLRRADLREAQLEGANLQGAGYGRSRLAVNMFRSSSDGSHMAGPTDCADRDRRKHADCSALTVRTGISSDQHVRDAKLIATAYCNLCAIHCDQPVNIL